MKKSIINLSLIIDILAVVFIIAIGVLRNNPSTNNLYQLLGIMFSGLVVLEILITKEKIKLTGYTLWNIIFLIISISSLMWAMKIPHIIQSLIVNTIITFCLINYMKSDIKLQVVRKAVIWSGIVLCAYVIIKSNIDLNYGARISIENFNANEVGISLVISYLIALYDKNRLIHYIEIIFLIFGILICGSRTALIFVLIGTFVFYLIREKSLIKIFKNVVLACTVIGILLILIYNVDFLYNILGIRIDSLLGRVDINEGSSVVRMGMIAEGIQLFKEKPMFGYGIGNFRYVTISGYGYAHNNYIELLVGIGLIGTIVYYSIYWIIAVKCLRIYKYYPKEIALIVAMSISLLIVDIGTVSYYRLFYNIVLALIYTWLILLTKKVKINKGI